ncbi:hypothetical protein [Streptomyces sp. NPDC002133]|uniref:hypothetical protein n=1 Tax=Streptomyces sp. NPDC002133 TaxID=3154409 RepID=UPI00332BE190
MVGPPLRATDAYLPSLFDVLSGHRRLRNCPPRTSTRSGWGENSGEKPDPQRPLSEIECLFLAAVVPPGQLSTELTVPTVADGVAEPAESVRFQASDGFDERRTVRCSSAPVVDTS